MDKNISQGTPARTTSTQSQTQGVKKTPKPANLLKMMTGAGAKLTQVAQDAQATAGRLSSALKPAAAEGSELKAPELPATEEKKGFFENMVSVAQKAQTQAHESRRDLLSKAGETTPSGSKFVANDDVTALYQAGKGKLGTDEKAIRELLWDRTPEQLEAVAAVYKDRYDGRDLWKDLNREFEDPNDKRMVAALRKGDRAGAAAAELVDATTGQTSKKRVRDVLSRLSPEEASKAQTLYSELHPKGRELSDWTDRKFKGERGNQVDALLKGDSQSAELAGLRHSLDKGKGAEVVAQLRDMDPEARKEFVERFDSSAEKGQDLASLVGSLKGTNRDQAQALVQGNQAGADAALIQDALDGMGSNKRKLWEGLGSEIKDPKERQAYQKSVEREYNRMYGPESKRGGRALSDRLKSELSGENEEKALTLLQNGEVPPEKQLKFALGGSKKDGLELAALVEQHGPEKARQMYSEATRSKRHPEGRDLDADIQNRLGGRGRYEAEVAMKGQPQTPEEKVARTVDRTRFELTGAGGAFTNSDDILKNNTRRAEEALEQLKVARAAGDEKAVAEWTTRIDELTGYAKADTEVFRDEKDGAVEVAAGVAAGVAAAGAIAVTGGAAAPFVAMAAGAVTNYGTRNLMAGNAYDQNNAAKDLFVGGMEGVGVKGGALLGRAAKGMVQSRVRNAGTKRLLGNVAEGTADGITGGALMGATETALADGTWEDGAASGLGKVLSGGASGGAVGGAFGGSMGAGLDGAGRVYSKVRGGDKVAPNAPVEGPPRPRPVEPAENLEISTGPKSADPSVPAGKSQPTGAADAPAPIAVKVVESPDAKMEYDPEALLGKLRQTEFKPVGEKFDYQKFGEVSNRTFANMDAEKEARRALDKAKGQGADADQIAKLEADYQKAKAADDATRAEYSEHNTRKKSWNTRADVFRAEAEEVLKRAQDGGRTDTQFLSRDDVELMAFKIYQDMKKSGRVSSNEFPELGQALRPFEVNKVDGYDAVARAQGVTPGSNFHSETGEQLAPDQLTSTQLHGDVVKVNRLLELNPTEVVAGESSTKLFSSSARDVEDSKLALGRLGAVAPRILDSVKELHFIKLGRTKVARFSQAAESGVAPSQVSSKVGGFVSHSTPDGTMAIRSGALSEKEHVYLRSQVDEAARGDIQDAIEQGDVPQKSLKDKVDDYKELVRTREVGLPEARSREISTLHVIAHEGAHSLDKARGWASVSGEFGPFGGNGIVDEKGFTGKGKFSRTETTDYVSHYAQDHTGLSLPKEDFAETAAFISTFPFLKEKPRLGPLSPALVAKIRGAGKALDTPQEQIDAILNHYELAP